MKLRNEPLPAYIRCPTVDSVSFIRLINQFVTNQNQDPIDSFILTQFNKGVVDGSPMCNTNIMELLGMSIFEDGQHEHPNLLLEYRRKTGGANSKVAAKDDALIRIINALDDTLVNNEENLLTLNVLDPNKNIRDITKSITDGNHVFNNSKVLPARPSEFINEISINKSYPVDNIDEMEIILGLRPNELYNIPRMHNVGDDKDLFNAIGYYAYARGLKLSFMNNTQIMANSFGNAFIKFSKLPFQTDNGAAILENMNTGAFTSYILSDVASRISFYDPMKSMERKKLEPAVELKTRISMLEKINVKKNDAKTLLFLTRYEDKIPKIADKEQRRRLLLSEAEKRGYTVTRNLTSDSSLQDTINFYHKSQSLGLLVPPSATELDFSLIANSSPSISTFIEKAKVLSRK